MCSLYIACLIVFLINIKTVFFLIFCAAGKSRKAQCSAAQRERILQLTAFCLVIYRLVCDYIGLSIGVSVCGDSKVVFEKQFSS